MKKLCQESTIVSRLVFRGADGVDRDIAQHFVKNGKSVEMNRSETMNEENELGAESGITVRKVGTRSNAILQESLDFENLFTKRRRVMKVGRDSNKNKPVRLTIRHPMIFFSLQSRHNPLVVVMLLNHFLLQRLGQRCRPFV